MRRSHALLFATLSIVLAAPAQAQRQVVKPPVAVYWMSVETGAGMSMPGMGAMGAMMPGMAGGAGQSGRRMLLQLGSQRSASGEPKAEHAIPAAMNMGAALPLVASRSARAMPQERGMPQGMERPRGRMLIYWGCGEKARAGQPVVIDFAKAGSGGMPALAARQVARGTPPAPGRSRSYGDWPNAESSIPVPDGASLVGEHVVKGNYSPEIRFSLDGAHDFMPRAELSAAPAAGGAARVRWNEVANATGYFATVMGAQNEDEVVFWSSSEVQEMGGMLMDYLPPAEVARLVRDKVVLSPQTTQCAVPDEVVRKAGGSAFLNFVAYGPEANYAQPPRPKDPKQAWAPDWAVKARFKSTASLLLGEGDSGSGSASRETPASGEQREPASGEQGAKPDAVQEGVNTLRRIFGN